MGNDISTHQLGGNRMSFRHANTPAAHPCGDLNDEAFIVGSHLDFGVRDGVADADRPYCPIDLRQDPGTHRIIELCWNAVSDLDPELLFGRDLAGDAEVLRRPATSLRFFQRPVRFADPIGAR